MPQNLIHSQGLHPGWGNGSRGRPPSGELPVSACPSREGEDNRDWEAALGVSKPLCLGGEDRVTKAGFLEEGASELSLTG